MAFNRVPFRSVDDAATLAPLRHLAQASRIHLSGTVVVRASEERWRPRQGFSPRALLGGPPLVRGHAAWVLGRIGTEAASGRLEVEEDAWVREEAEGVIEP
jgi:hypothetical protein